MDKPRQIGLPFNHVFIFTCTSSSRHLSQSWWCGERRTVPPHRGEMWNMRPTQQASPSILEVMLNRPPPSSPPGPRAVTNITTRLASNPVLRLTRNLLRDWADFRQLDKKDRDWPFYFTRAGAGIQPGQIIKSILRGWTKPEVATSSLSSLLDKTGVEVFYWLYLVE